MLKAISPFATRIVIGVASFLFGFFVIASALDLSLSEIMVGLVSGAVCGATILVVTVVDKIYIPRLRGSPTRTEPGVAPRV
jgi:hypothetical protein